MNIIDRFRRAVVRSLPLVTGVHVVAILTISLVSSQPVHAQVRTWSVIDPILVHQTAVLLERFYSLTRPDSARLRYVTTWGESLPYQFRGRLASPDSVAAILSMTLGQLTIFPTDDIRIALGDDLYSRLLAVGSQF